MSIIRQNYGAIGDNPTQAMIAPVLYSDISGVTWPVGSQFILGDVLYTVTVQIGSGEQIIPGTNCEVSDSITQQIKNLFIAPDYSNIVKTFTSAEITTSGAYEFLTNPYEVTQDCFLCGYLVYRKGMTSIDSLIRVNGVNVADAYGRLNTSPTYIEDLYIGVFLPIKKGQTLSIRAAAGTIATSMKLYGVLT